MYYMHTRVLKLSLPLADGVEDIESHPSQASLIDVYEQDLESAVSKELSSIAVSLELQLCK